VETVRAKVRQEKEKNFEYVDVGGGPRESAATKTTTNPKTERGVSLEGKKKANKTHFARKRGGVRK